jgi:hypothetical protein
MDDDEELRSQCFGGDHPTSSFDQPVMKRYYLLYKLIFILFGIDFYLDNVVGGMHIYYFMKNYLLINQIR